MFTECVGFPRAETLNSPYIYVQILEILYYVVHNKPSERVGCASNSRTSFHTLFYNPRVLFKTEDLFNRIIFFLFECLVRNLV